MQKIKCPECKGKGETPCSLDYGDDEHPDNCPVCGGDPTVRIACAECDGTGKVDDC